MKERNPIDRHDLRINKSDKVLEVGSGHNPTYRANVIVEKYISYNYHRGGDIKIYPHQKFINADGSSMPFKDKDFDYVICAQVLEHVDDPIALVNELQRTATRGYLEVPSFIGESLFPKKSHKWVCLEINGKLVLFDKAKLPSLFPDYGKTFLNFLPYESISLRIFYLAYHQITTVRYEWKDSIDILVNPDDPYYRAFFEQDWSDEMIRTIFPYRDKKNDLQITISAFFHLVKTLVKRKMQRQSPITLEEYLKRTNQTL